MTQHLLCLGELEQMLVVRVARDGAHTAWIFDACAECMVEHGTTYHRPSRLSTHTTFTRGQGQERTGPCGGHTTQAILAVSASLDLCLASPVGGGMRLSSNTRKVTM